MDSPLHPCNYLEESQSAFAEMIRSLRTNLLVHYKRGLRSYLFTSCWPDEGKSTVTLNLAASLAEIGLKVLLVDGDLRQRSLTQLLLSGAEHHDLEIQTTAWIPGISIVAAPSPSQLGPGDRLVQADYRAIIQQHARHFDVLLMDSPPLSACSDALVLCQWVDGVLMVCNQDKFQGIPEGHYSEDLRDAGAELLGVVLTGVGLARGH